MKHIFLALLGAFFSLASFSQNSIPDTIYYQLDKPGRVAWESVRVPDSKQDSVILNSGFKRPTSIIPAGYFIEINGFKISEGGELYWQRVFESDLAMEDLFVRLASKGITDVYQKGNSFSGKFEDIQPDFIGMRVESYHFPDILNQSLISASVLVDFKDGKYRVTLTNLLFKRHFHNVNIQNNRYIEIPTVSFVSYYAVDYKDSDLKVSAKFRKDFSKVMNFTFEGLFQIPKDVYSEDW